MTFPLFLKTSMIWFAIVILAIANAVFRETVLVSLFGQNMALPLSGILLSLIVFIVTYLSFPLYSKNNMLIYLLIGLQWVVMTLLFEVFFGHYVMGKSWSSILQMFNIMKGDLMILVLLVSLVSPILVAKIKNNIL